MSLAASLAVLFVAVPTTPYDLDQGHYPAVVSAQYEWIRIGDLNVSIRLTADAMGAIMLSMVTLVSLLVAIYSAGYMRGDPGYPRFFAEVSLFVFAMCMLVLASNFLVLFVFWEGVGLCSYLLIGFWFRRPSAAAAARKAFLVNRIGDFGFLLGVFLIWVTFGTVNYQGVFENQGFLEQVARDCPGRLELICLLLFLGAVGKSAQFPLHVWLPDAMEGPSPVSALIHAATMVTAGVYMVARCTPLFVHAPLAQLVVAGIGAFTALMAALIALTQNDLKRVLAYSTVSQLGYMFLALGCAAADKHVVTLAVTAAMFHLFTHAFFKALLFLSAGSVMHSMGDVIDMRRFGGLRRVLPMTHLTFLCGAAALAGVPLLSGFWSKDEILAAVGCSGARRGALWNVLPGAADHGRGDGVADGVLYVSSLLPDVLGRGAVPGRSRPSSARVAAGDERAAAGPGGVCPGHRRDRRTHGTVRALLGGNPRADGRRRARPGLGADVAGDGGGGRSALPRRGWLTSAAPACRGVRPRFGGTPTSGR